MFEEGWCYGSGGDTVDRGQRQGSDSKGGRGGRPPGQGLQGGSSPGLAQLSSSGNRREWGPDLGPGLGEGAGPRARESLPQAPEGAVPCLGPGRRGRPDPAATLCPNTLALPPQNCPDPVLPARASPSPADHPLWALRLTTSYRSPTPQPPAALEGDLEQITSCLSPPLPREGSSLPSDVGEAQLICWQREGGPGGWSP